MIFITLGNNVFQQNFVTPMQYLTANKTPNFSKIVNACNSYSRFSEVKFVNQKHVSTIGNQTCDCQSVRCANCKYQTYLKSVFKMSSMRSNASQKTWTPLPDCFINEQLVEMFPLLIRCDFSGSTSRIWLQYTRSCSLPQILQSTRLRSGLLAGHRAGAMKSGVRVNSYMFSH